MKKWNKGFTLVELVVTVVIVGVLAAMAYIKLDEVIEAGRARNAKVQLAAIYSAAQMYKAKNGYYPAHVWGNDTVNAFFNLKIEDSAFSYYFISSATLPGINYTVQAERNLPANQRYMYRMHSPESSPLLPVIGEVYCASPTYTPSGWTVCPVP